MSGMGIADVFPTDKDNAIKSLEEAVAYWKMRSEILENTCRALGSLVSPDVVKSVSERVCADINEKAKVTQDKVVDTEESSPVDAKVDTEYYKLIAEKALAENGVLREEIERLHETLRFIEVLSRSDSPSKTPKVTSSIQ